MSDPAEHYERHLPHQFPTGFPIFLCWNLKGSLPKSVLVEIEHDRERMRQEPLRAGESERERRSRHSKLLFGRRDRYLDIARQGPMHLRDPRAAQIVIDSIL
jgi:hypothetical protein